MHALPSLYISHGSPMTALHPGLSGERLSALAAGLPRPKAIVMASAHWLTREPRIGSGATHATIHDFGGFPDTLYAMRYESPGAPSLAGDIGRLLEETGFRAQLDASRGLDHGAWVPLRLMYPLADIPVVPLSIQPARDPAHHYAVGRALATLREQGVLVIGSGSITHNLHDLGAGYSAERQAPYVEPFIEWVEHKLAAGDIERPARLPPPGAVRRARPSHGRTPVAVVRCPRCGRRWRQRANASMPASTWACWRWISIGSIEGCGTRRRSSGDALQVRIIVGDDRQFPVLRRQQRQAVGQARLVALRAGGTGFPRRLYFAAHRRALRVDAAMGCLADTPCKLRRSASAVHAYRASTSRW